MDFSLVNIIPGSFKLKELQKIVDEDAIPVIMEYNSEKISAFPLNYPKIGEYELFTEIAGVLVEKSLNEKCNFDADYFLTEITETDNLYVPLIAPTQGLPCNTMYIINPDKETIIEDNLKLIQKQDEIYIRDLYCNAWKYKYDPEIDAFCRLDEEDAYRNLIKGYIAKKAAYVGGSCQDRLADYGRIILFLLSKVQLTDSEKEQLEGLLSYAPSVNDISNVIKREELVQQTVSEHKKSAKTILGIE